MEKRKKRLNPSKLLILLMYGSYPYLEVNFKDDNTRELILDIGSFARLMRVKKQALVEYIDWLDMMGYIVLVSKSNRTIKLDIHTPPLFKKTI